MMANCSDMLHWPRSISTPLMSRIMRNHHHSKRGVDRDAGRNVIDIEHLRPAKAT
jgi:hypothetical protein